jgi:hypothetical protein|tara:strand:+ start:647 stop:1171 length:525 start_codon:yes stop_codon:yes gene_type:complete
MKLETLKKLTPSSPDLTGKKSKVNNALSTEDVLMKLSFCKLTSQELDFVVGKYLDNNECLSNFYQLLVINIYKDKEFDEGDKDLVCNLVKCCIIECTVTKCVFCSGRGFYKNKDGIEKCTHCNDGDFIYDDNVRANLLNLNKKKYKTIKSKYEKILEMIQNIELEALEKIGDVY